MSKNKGRRPPKPQYLLEAKPGIKLCSEERFRHMLRAQMHFLRKSAADYDNGDDVEAMRIAVTLRIMLHTNPKPSSNNKGLLYHLGIQDALRYVDTGVYRKNHIAAALANGPKGCKIAYHSPLDVGLMLPVLSDNGTATWEAPLVERRFSTGDPREKSLVSDNDYMTWWTTELIEGLGVKFSRKSIVLAIANQDGGAHVDANLESFYKSFKEGDLAFVAVSGRPEKPVGKNPAFACIRQIAFELLLTLERFLSSADGQCYTEDGLPLGSITQSPSLHDRGMTPLPPPDIMYG